MKWTSVKHVSLILPKSSCGPWSSTHGRKHPAAELMTKQGLFVGPRVCLGSKPMDGNIQLRSWCPNKISGSLREPVENICLSVTVFKKLKSMGWLPGCASLLAWGTCCLVGPPPWLLWLGGSPVLHSRAPILTQGDGCGQIPGPGSWAPVLGHVEHDGSMQATLLAFGLACLGG